MLILTLLTPQQPNSTFQVVITTKNLPEQSLVTFLNLIFPYSIVS